jgi:hypothetical protein
MMHYKQIDFQIFSEMRSKFVKELDSNILSGFGTMAVKIIAETGEERCGRGVAESI